MVCPAFSLIGGGKEPMNHGKQKKRDRASKTAQFVAFFGRWSIPFRMKGVCLKILLR
jgi:hypothetical protein